MAFNTSTTSSSSSVSLVSISNPVEKTNVDVPEELRTALLDFSVAFLMDKPNDVVNYAVKYFTSIQLKRIKMRGGVDSLKSEFSNKSINQSKQSFENAILERGSLYSRTTERRSSVIRSLSESAALPHRTSILREAVRRSATLSDSDRRSYSERLSAERRSGERRVSMHPDLERSSREYRSEDLKSYEERLSAERRVSMHPDLERSSREYRSEDRKSNEERLSAERKSADRRVSMNMDSERSRGDRRSYSERLSAERKGIERRVSMSPDLELPHRDTERLNADRRGTDRVSIINYASKNPPAASHFTYSYEPLPRRRSLFIESFDTGDMRLTDDHMGQWDVQDSDRRKSFFNESFDPNGSDDEGELDGKELKIPKSREQAQRIKKSIKQLLIFKQLDKQQLRDIVNCMTQLRVCANEIVVEQDTVANDFYVIDSGTFNVYKDDFHVYTFYNEGMFGELALISTRQRLATIRAATDGALWVLNRCEFRHIVESKSYYKRIFYEKQLRKVYMLKVLPKDKIMTLADSLQEISYKKGDSIFLQGEKPNGMYIVLQGVVQIKARDVNGIEKKVHRIGDSPNFFDELVLLQEKPKSSPTQDVCKKPESQKFFGELSLLKKQHTARFVSAYAATHHVKLAFLSLDSFDRIVGDSAEECYLAVSDHHPHYLNLLKFYRSLQLGGKLL